jgi:hypothetical protein
MSSDPAEAAVQRRVAPPLSLKIGGTWYSYARLEPFATAIGTLVDGVNGFKNVQNSGDAAKSLTSIWKSAVGQVRDKTFLRGFSDLVNAVDNPERGGMRWIESFATSWVPNIAKAIGRETDPSIRESRDWGELDDAFWNRRLTRLAYKALPGLVTPPPPKVDLWGREVGKLPSSAPLSDWLYRVAVPVRQQPAATGFEGDLDRMLLVWNHYHPYSIESPKTPDPTFTFKNRRWVIQDEQLYHDYLKAAGEAAVRALRRAHAVRAFNFDSPSEADIERLKRTVSEARSVIKKSLIERNIKALETDGQVKQLQHQTVK